jgi:hypothetical protein
MEPNEITQRSKTMPRNTTKIDPGTGGPDEERGRTLPDTSADDLAHPRRKPEGHQRRLTGVLVTFRWRLQGELFPLYEGRNIIGSSDSCDVHVETDKMMSGEHAVILCRAGRDELHDMLSTNGTFLNEKYVDREGADLVDKALIKIGATIFEFRKFTHSGEKVLEGDRPDYFEDDSPKPYSGGETAI